MACSIAAGGESHHMLSHADRECIDISVPLRALRAQEYLVIFIGPKRNLDAQGSVRNRLGIPNRLSDDLRTE